MLAGSRAPFGHASSNMQQQNLLGLAGMGYPELQLLSNLGSLMGQQHLQDQQNDDDERGASAGGRTRSGDSRSSSAYASRHQAAEQRRRNRINERLDLLRKLVPHAERANTACFLEEVIRYVEQLRNRNATLEKTVKELQGGAAAGGMPAPPAVSAAAAPAANLQSLALTGTSGADLQQSPAAAAGVPGLAQSQVPAELPGVAAAVTPIAGAAGQPAPQQTDPAPASAPAGSSAPVPAGTAAAPSTSQALMGLQGLLPEGIDVQTLLQQALINAQVQLLQQHQQHQAALAAVSNGGPASSAGAAVSTDQHQQQSDQQQQKLAQQQCQQQQAVLQPVLQSPPSLVLQPPGQPQPASQNTVSVGPASSAHTAAASGGLANIQQHQPSQQQPDIFTAARPAASTTAQTSNTTLPPELRKLKAQLDFQAGGPAKPDLAGLQQQQQQTSQLLALAPESALSSVARSQGGNPAGSHSAAPGSSLHSAFAALSGAGSGKAHISNYHMDRTQLLAAAAAAASGVDDVNSAALMAELSAVAAAGAADNAAAIAVAERASSMASGHEEGEEGENTVPHKKRKMLVL